MPFIKWRAFGVSANLTGLRKRPVANAAVQAQEIATEINLVRGWLLTSAMEDQVG